jgi:ribonuclease J
MKPTLKFIALSGTTGVTENLYIYEYDNDMIVVDCGVGFPESDMLGVDLVIPDFSYIKKNISKLRGIVISHGHEDHMGGLPFLLKEVDTPIYATKLVDGFIQDKLTDYGITKGRLNVFDPEKDVLTLGVFKITPFRVSHSVPDGVGFAIDTPEGRVFHIPDYKFDWTPVDGKPFDVAKLASLASQGALALASDTLGSTTPGYTESEREIEERIEGVVQKSTGKVYFTTISSNVSRMQQAINVAQRVGRKIVFIGRSIVKKTEIAKNLGFLFYQDGVVISPKQAAKLPANKLIFVISGCYGQPGSALYRLATGDHDFLNVGKGDVVVFSADPGPPGSKGSIDFLVDKFIELNVGVHYYDMQEDLHVSGHGSMKDIEMLFALVRPKYFIPIGGTIRHNKAYGQIAQSMGAKETDVFNLKAGEIVEFSGGAGKKNGRIYVKDVLVDGLGIGDVGNIVLRDRQTLSRDGFAVALIQFDRNEAKVISAPEIISKGFVFEEKSKDLLIETGRDLLKVLSVKKSLTAKMVKDTAIDFLEKYFFEKTGRRPMVLPVVVEL